MKVFVVLSAVTVFGLAACTSETTRDMARPTSAGPACNGDVGNVNVPPVHPVPGLQALVGKDARDIKSVDGYKLVRMLPPNSIMTMDYRNDRINLWVDCDFKVLSVTIG